MPSGSWAGGGNRSCFIISGRVPCVSANFAGCLPEATQKMLTQTLRELEKDGLVLRTVYPQVPPKVVYSITSYGLTLKPILIALCAWGEKDFKRRKNLKLPEEAAIVDVNRADQY